MWKPLIRCSIVGGIIVFLWIMVSWMILPFHQSMMHKFDSESAVTDCIVKEAPKNGIYVLPHRDISPKEEVNQREAKGPFIFMSIRREGMNYDNMIRPMIIGLITQVTGAFLVTFLLLQTKKSTYWKRVWFVTIAGVFVALIGFVPPWNWWGFPGAWVIAEMFDVAIGWFLGGLVIARLVK